MKDVSTTFDVEETVEERVGSTVTVVFGHCCMVDVNVLDNVWTEVGLSIVLVTLGSKVSDEDASLVGMLDCTEERPDLIVVGQW